MCSVPSLFLPVLLFPFFVVSPDLLLYGSLYKAVDAFAVRFGVGFDNVFVPLGHGQVDPVISSSYIVILPFCFSLCHIITPQTG